MKTEKGQRENRGAGVVTYPCQLDGPEGYDSPVPASERPGHQAQARAWQATNTHTQTQTTPFTDTENFLGVEGKNIHAALQPALMWLAKKPKVSQSTYTTTELLLQTNLSPSGLNTKSKLLHEV